ncbi:hypothetical protein [Halosimplex sp. J119]
MPNEDTDTGVDRRGVLKMIGGATAGLGLLSGRVSAHSFTFDECETVCTDTDGNFAVVEVGTDIEGRELSPAPERETPWDHDNTFCYTAADDETVVGFIEEDVYRGDERADDGCTLHVNPNDCASVGVGELLGRIDRDTIGVCDGELYPPCDPMLPEADWVEFGETFDTDWDEIAESVVQTADGGFALAGRRRTADQSSNGALLVTDGDGDEQFRRTYGGDELDSFYDVVQTSDGGFAMAGLTRSFGADGYDGWLVKTDAEGNEEFNRTYGGDQDDRAFAVVQTADGGFVLGGDSEPTDDRINHFWLVKTDEEGNEQFSRTYGDKRGGTMRAMVQTRDGGFALTGTTVLEDTFENAILLLKTDEAGNEEFRTVLDSEEATSANSLVQTDDGGFALAGSGVTDEKAGEFWLVKTDESGDTEFVRNYGGDELDLADGIVNITDGGFALAGLTQSFGAEGTDMYLVTTDENGEKTSDRTYGTCGEDRARDLVLADDGSYVLAGEVAGSERVRPTEMALVKTVPDLE